jgi:two-component system, chemotaxis family, CheB/CheR fusion protein
VVALGASAGGLDPLRAFFAAMPSHDRIAFVVITHLAPDRPSHMAELLARVSPMPVEEARDGSMLEGGHLYVIAPNTLLGVRDGRLTLAPAAARPRIPLPVDHFMRELADAFGERAVGIVMSGSDHDGTVGLAEIRTAGGLAIVQDPQTAAFRGMPSAAIDAGVADLVLAPAQMPGALLDYVDTARPPVAAPGDGSDDAPPEPALQAIVDLIVERTDHDFRWYRPAMLRRRLRRRMAMARVTTLAEYLQRLTDSPAELEALTRDFLIGVTEFYRDPLAWSALELDVLPRVCAPDRGDEPVRAWTPGCATGEESYSLAMLLLERVGTRAGGVSVFATDVDEAALRVARAGSYSEAATSGLPPERLQRFFESVGERRIARRELRDAVLFTRQNLVRDTPFSRLDLVVCRNLLIYFEPALQSRVLELFHFALKPGGYLFLGRSETVGPHVDLFEPVSTTHRIFRSIGPRTQLPRWFPGRRSPGTPLAPAPPSPVQSERGAGDALRAKLGERAVSAAILVNRDLRALFFLGETHRYLQPSGEASWQLVPMVRERYRLRVRAALHRAIGEARPVRSQGPREGPGSDAPTAIRIEPLDDFAVSGLLVVSFTDPARPARTDDPSPTAPDGLAEMDEQATLAELETALSSTEGTLTAALAAAEANNQALRVANEEATSMGEELQSANEELETSKEEMQSLNEELATANAELQDSYAEVSRTNSDLTNLLSSTRIATLFLDRELRVRRFTPTATRLFSLIASDVGRPLADVASRLIDPALFDDARRVMASGESAQCEVPTAAGDWFLRRIQPYEAPHDALQGVVVTCVDITALRRAADESRRLATILRDSNDAVFVHGLDGRIDFWNDGAERQYGLSRAQAIGRDVYTLAPAGEREVMRAAVARALAERSNRSETGIRVGHDGHPRSVSVTLSALVDDAGKPTAVVHTERDITERLAMESEIRFRRLVDDVPALVVIEDAVGRARFVNQPFEAFVGTPAVRLDGEQWVQALHSDDRPGYQSARDTARRSRTRCEHDVRLRRHDGEFRWMRSVWIPQSSSDDTPGGFVGLLIDSEERKQLEQAVALSDRRKDEFVAMLAHELRNPLAPIRNAANVIQRAAGSGAGADTERTTWAIDVIVRQSTHLARILDDLLDVARISRGILTVHRSTLDLQAVVAHALEASRLLIDARRQRLEVELPPEPVRVDGDLVRLAQVLENLLNNAAKYTPVGGSIRMQVHRENGEAVIEVIDDGIGIAPEMLPRVFDLFMRVERDGVGQVGGLGLGLAIVRRIVELHEGRVEAHSDGTDRGSRFVVRLPVLEATRSLTGGHGTAAAPFPAVGRRVLIVDDNIDGAMAVGAVLEMDGHQVRTVHDGRDVLRIAAEFRPEVVMMDIEMPHVDGYTLARALRREPGTVDCLLLAYTGFGQPTDTVRAFESGFDRHLVKPADPDTLRGLVALGPQARSVTPPPPEPT